MAAPLRIGRGRAAAYLALTLAWLGLGALGLGEALLRATWTPPSARTTPAFGDHPLYGSAPLPGVRGAQVTSEYDARFEHNLLGFRGPLPDLAPDADAPRLLLLGDSQTYGLGCSEGRTFADVLRGELEGVEVLNAGCNGYGTRESLAVVHHLGAAWRPRVACLVFFWNDVEDNWKRSSPAFALDAQGRVVRDEPGAFRHDPLALLAPATSTPPEPAGLYLARFVKEGLRGLRYRLFGIKPRLIRDEAQRAEAWAVTRELLNLLARHCAELDVELVVAALPDHNQVDPTAVIKNIEPLNYAVQDELFAACAELGVATVDLLPPLRERFEARGEPLYYYADRHLNEDGARVVGEALADTLRERLGASDLGAAAAR